MPTISAVLALVALVLVIASAVNRAPLWAAVLVLVLLELVRIFPPR